MSVLLLLTNNILCGFVRCFSKKFKLGGENFLFFQNITLKVETFAASVYVGITAQDRSSFVIFEKIKEVKLRII